MLENKNGFAAKFKSRRTRSSKNIYPRRTRAAQFTIEITGKLLGNMDILFLVHTAGKE